MSNNSTKEKKDVKEKKQDIDKNISNFKISTTYHSMEINKEPLNYTANTGFMELFNSKEEHTSNVFFFSYEKNGCVDKSKRPITFVFNGGPGCSSIWLHFGGVGPKRIKMKEDGTFLPPPYILEDNHYTWLEFTDIVFIDPVGTGYSHAKEGVDPKQFWGVKEDIESVAEFIRLYITKNERWLSPKYIAGESYGTTRAAGLSDYLQEDHLCIDLNGIILISSVLNAQDICFAKRNDLPYMLFLPTYTSIAFYHNKLPTHLLKNLDQTLKEVEEWVLSDYVSALAYGNNLSEEKKDEIADKLSQYTGVSKKFVKHCNLRISAERFRKELLRDQYRTIGRMDGRLKGVDADAAGEHAEYDPGFLNGPLVAAVNHHVRKNLKYENDLPYTVLSIEANTAWKWLSYSNKEMGYFDVSESLRQTMHKNRYMNIFFACGAYDLATPFFSAKYTISHMEVNPTLRENVELNKYLGGHMIYYPKDSLVKFKDDIKKFFDKSNCPEYISQI